ncbi:MAG: glycoside hydrolase family 88 protein [Vicinamibacterales bacterium]
MRHSYARRRTVALTVLALALAWAIAPSAGRPTAPDPVPGWGVRFADTVVATWPDPAAIDPAKNGWEYNTGIVLFGMSKMYEATKDPRYLHYIRRWVDGYVDGQGVLGWDQSRTHNLDYIQPGMLILFLYEQTGEARYQAAAKTVREAFDRIPKNADGGFWHKSQYPNEMWIDGIYMGEPFLVNYGRLFGDAAFGNDMAVFQSTLAAAHCLDPKTGLLYHAWDQDRNAAWADPKTGRSPVIWGRGMGWFVMAMVDILEQLPPSHPGYPRLHELLRKNVAGLARAQDPTTGLWYQVLDQGASLAGNWIETSSSGMFIYAVRKAVRLNLVEPSYLTVAERGWAGLQATFEQDPSGRPVFTGAVQGMGVQTDAAGYLKIPRLKNSTHGLMAVMIAASEMEPGRATPAAFRNWPADALPAVVGRRVAENFAARPFQRPAAFIIYPEVCTWYGALTLADLTGNTGLRERLVRKFDPLFTPEGSKNISPNPHVDYRVFGTVPLEIFIQTKDARFLDLGRSFADKQWETTTPDGITSEARYWIDDMFMITAVQVQAYRATGDRTYVDRAALAMVAYLDRLQQPNGLFFHAPDSPFYWSRGNGWMAAGSAELLRSLPETHPARPRILEGYRRMMTSLLAMQGEDGLWRQLLDHPEAWPETSGTGMFASAMVTGVRNGWLDERTYGPAARKAWLGLVKYIDADANVSSVCAGTNKGPTVQYYLDRPRNTGDLHGQAPVLWTASALLR